MHDQKPEIRKKIVETKDLDDDDDGRALTADRRIQNAIRRQASRRRPRRADDARCRKRPQQSICVELALQFVLRSQPDSSAV